MSGRKYLLVSEPDSSWVAVDPDSDKIYELDAKNFQDKPEARSYFSFFDHSGSKWVSVNSNFLRGSLDPNDLLGLAVHEDFHQHRQESSWFPSGHRVTELPLSWEPRYYRAQIDLYLRKAIENPSLRDQVLPKAKYWYDLWRLQFPNEVSSTTDGYEGSAKFAEEVGIALANYGCEISNTDLRSKVAGLLLKEVSLLELRGTARLDSEGYRIGSQSAFILRFDLGNKDWLASIEKSIGPLESLMNLVPESTSDNEPSPYLEIFKTQTANQQKEVDLSLDSTIQKIKNQNRIFVSVPHDWRQGSLSYRGFYLLKDIGIDLSILGQNFTLSGEAGTINVLDGAVDLSIESPCPTSYGWTFPILQSEQTLTADGKFSISSEKINGTLSAELIKDTQGRTWLCAKPFR